MDTVFAEKPKRKRFIDHEGQRFGRLLVLGYVGVGSYSSSLWLCLCDCGKETFVTASCLQRSRGTKSCGCLQREWSSRKAKARKTHGMTGSREYISYQAMLTRCENEKASDYKNYGGRGISVCKRWRDSFENFYSDMGTRPEGTSLDRIDNDGNYEPGNCRWSTRLQQGNNQRTNRFLDHDGRKMTVSQWSRETGIVAATIKTRLRKGWSIYDALTKPTRKYIEYDGRSQTISEWSREVGIGKATVRKRLQLGWSVHDALTKPAGR